MRQVALFFSAVILVIISVGVAYGIAVLFRKWSMLQIAQYSLIGGITGRRFSERRPVLWLVVAFSSAIGPLIALVFSARPIFGLLVPLFIVLISPIWWRYQGWKKEAYWENGALAYFQGLKALIKVGMALPSAMARIGLNSGDEFSKMVLDHINAFESGKTLAQCFGRMGRYSMLRRVSVIFCLLENSYRKGLPMAPILETSLSAFESHLNLRRKLLALRRSALGPVLLAALLPWGMALVMCFFQQDLMQAVWKDHTQLLFLVAALALGMECIGGIIVWRLCRYY